MTPWLLFSTVCIAIILALWIPSLRLKRALDAPFPDEPLRGRQPGGVLRRSDRNIFEKPRQMALNHAELFSVLKDYYRIDPGDWQEK